MGMLDGKVAFITGGPAASAKGRRCGSREGAKIGLADMQPEEGEQVRAEIEQAGGQALFFEMDMSDLEGVKSAIDGTVEKFDGTVEKFGRLDIVFANAGINGVWAPVEELSPDEWDKTLDINLKGTFLTVHYAVPHLKQGGGGSIIITSSVNGNRTFSNPGASAYNASKAGQVAFMKMTALELGRYHIRVNAVCPDAIETNIDERTEHHNTEKIGIKVEMPEGSPALNEGQGEPIDVADTCLFLASDLSRHVSGVDIYHLCGRRRFPAALAFPCVEIMMIPIITNEQTHQFEEQGYFILENVFTPDEMERVTLMIEGYQKQHEEALTARGGTEGISRAGEITFTDHLAENDPEIAAFVTRPEFVVLATQLLGPDIDLYWNQSVFKQPEGTRQFPWHQDDGYTPVTPSPYLTLWLALNDATPENGCISVLPGSHKRGLVPHHPSPIGLVCHEADDPDQGVLVPVSSGSMAVFQSLTMHKSGANTSSCSRKAYVIQYTKAGLRHADTGELITNEIPLTRDGKKA